MNFAQVLKAGKSYVQLPAKDPESLAIAIFASGLLDFRLAEHVLTQAPQTLSEAERIELEYLQIRSGINSARPRLRRKDRMPYLLCDSQPSGETPGVDHDQETELAPSHSF